MNTPTNDTTGRDRLAWNTVASWFGQFATIISGFILPRLISDNFDQSTLGVWDLSWSFVHYLNIMQIGLPSSVNRYLAKYNANQDDAAVMTLLSTVALIQLIQALLVLIIIAAVSYNLGYLFQELPTDKLRSAQLCSFFLGASLAVQILFSSSRGIITGYHRWDIHSYLNTFASVLALVTMATSLILGFGIIELAAVYLLSVLISELARWFVVKKMWPQLVRRYSHASFTETKRLLIYGSKSFLSNIHISLLVQTTNIIIVSNLGPAALAIFARPLALVRHISTFITKFTNILTPTASSLQGAGELEQIKALFLFTTKLTFVISLIPLSFFAIYGEEIISIWMGPDYVNAPLILALSAGHLLSLSADSSLRILMGLNKHGKLSIYITLVIITSFIVTWGILSLIGLDTTNASFLIIIPQTFAYGIFMPAYTCRIFGLSLVHYVKNSILTPLIISAPCLLLMGLSKVAFNKDEPLLALAVLTMAGVALGACCWSALITQDKKILLMQKFRMLIKRP